MNGYSCVPHHCVAVLVPRQTWEVIKILFLQHGIATVLWHSFNFYTNKKRLPY